MEKDGQPGHGLLMSKQIRMPTARSGRLLQAGLGSLEPEGGFCQGGRSEESLDMTLRHSMDLVSVGARLFS
jgi:hypothetical protein